MSVTSGTRDQILDAATALLDGSGPGFTYGALAKRAGVSRQTLYSHFPARSDVLVAIADRARSDHDADRLSADILGAPTARAALDALVDFHVAFTPRVANAARVLEYERATDPELERRFAARPDGRRQLVRHVVTRLAAEGDLAPTWSVDTATDIAASLLNATLTHELTTIRSWSLDELRARIHHVLARSLLQSNPEKGTPT